MVPLPTLTGDLAVFRAALASRPLEERLNFMHGLAKREMRRLWHEGLPLALAEMVAGEGDIVRHEGQNDLLPFFDRFEKHLVLRSGRVQGINVQKFAFATGPGHFSVRADGDEVWFDYTSLPESVPEGWPALVGNEGGISGLVYGHMIDKVRKVIDGMVVGKVFKHGKPEEHYFMLARR
ncbi:MAG: hypothetical protein EXR71_01445 [Myxococcales bacterium]|nr:hypothetical protein [Myxococcales bacterium]